MRCDVYTYTVPPASGQPPLVCRGTWSVRPCHPLPWVFQRVSLGCGHWGAQPTSGPRFNRRAASTDVWGVAEQRRPCPNPLGSANHDGMAETSGRSSQVIPGLHLEKPRDPKNTPSNSRSKCGPILFSLTGPGHSFAHEASGWVGFYLSERPISCLTSAHVSE